MNQDNIQIWSSGAPRTALSNLASRCDFWEMPSAVLLLLSFACFKLLLFTYSECFGCSTPNWKVSGTWMKWMWSSTWESCSSSVSLLLSLVISSSSCSCSSSAWATAVFSWASISCFAKVRFLFMEEISSSKIVSLVFPAVWLQLCSYKEHFCFFLKYVLCGKVTIFLYIHCHDKVNQ